MKQIMTAKILGKFLALGFLMTGFALLFPSSGLAEAAPCVTCIDYYTNGRELCSLTYADPYAGTCDYTCLPTDPGTVQPEGTYITYCGFEHPCTLDRIEDCY
jgi:hypothetical protein